MNLHRKVALLTQDLTGIMGWLSGEGPGRPRRRPRGRSRRLRQPALAARLADQGRTGQRTYPAAAARLPGGLPARCVAWHLDDLRRFRGRVIPLSDVEMIERDRAGNAIDRLDLMCGVALPAPDESWDWPVAPFGEAERHRESIHRVGAWRDFR